MKIGEICEIISDRPAALPCDTGFGRHNCMFKAMAGVFNTHKHNAHNVTSLMLSGLRGRCSQREINQLIIKMNQCTAKSMTDYWRTDRDKSRAMPWCCRGTLLNKWYRLNDWWYWILHICYLVKKHFLISHVFVFLSFMCSPGKAVIKTYTYLMIEHQML